MAFFWIATMNHHLPLTTLNKIQCQAIFENFGCVESLTSVSKYHANSIKQKVQVLYPQELVCIKLFVQIQQLGKG